MPRASRVAAPLFTAALMLAPSIVGARDEPLFGHSDRPRDTDRVNVAIDRGITFLLGKLTGERFGGQGQNAAGQLALETYALIVAGVAADHPEIKKNFELLDNSILGERNTYALVCYILALDAAITQLENDFLILRPEKIKRRINDIPSIGRAFRPRLRSAVEILIGGQHAHGGWRYQPRQPYDNSCTQFAVLGLGVGAKRGVPIPRSTWERIVDHFLRTQERAGPAVQARLTLLPFEERDGFRERITFEKNARPNEGRREPQTRPRGSGTAVKARPQTWVPVIGTEDIPVHARGWSYQAGREFSWNMTCSGVSSLLIAQAHVENDLSGPKRSELRASLRDGFGWLMRRWTPNWSYYGMYSLEKVADLGGVERFGSHDWYDEVSNHLLFQQEGDGGWAGGGGPGESSRVRTSFALLVLNRATTLVTSNPITKTVVVTGAHHEEIAERNREWVYVPDLEAHVHYPSLLRTLRLRPTVKLIQFLRDIVAHYAVEFRPELLPEIARIRDRMPTKSAQKVIDGYLQQIAGVRLEDTSHYLKWHERWLEVREIGDRKDQGRLMALLDHYRAAGDSLPLKQAAIRAMFSLSAREGLPLLLADLEHVDPAIRDAAYTAFRGFFVNPPPLFDPRADAHAREDQVQRIKTWFGQQ